MAQSYQAESSAIRQNIRTLTEAELIELASRLRNTFAAFAHFKTGAPVSVASTFALLPNGLWMIPQNHPNKPTGANAGIYQKFGTIQTYTDDASIWLYHSTHGWRIISSNADSNDGITPQQAQDILDNAAAITELADRVSDLEGNRATTTALEAETTNRENADSTERSARETADTNEASARAAADNTLTTADATINALIVALTARVNANEVALGNVADGGASFAVHSSFSSLTNYPFGDYIVDGQISYRVINPDGIAGSAPSPTNSNYIVIYDGRTRTAAEITAEIQALVDNATDYANAGRAITDLITGRAPSGARFGIVVATLLERLGVADENISDLSQNRLKSGGVPRTESNLNERTGTSLNHHTRHGSFVILSDLTGLPTAEPAGFRGLLLTIQEEETTARQQFLFSALQGRIYSRRFVLGTAALSPNSWQREDLGGLSQETIEGLINDAIAAIPSNSGGDGTGATIQARIWSNNVFASFTSQTNGQRTITLSADITAADSAVVWILGTVGSGADIVHSHWKFPAAALLAATANAPEKDGSVVIVQARASAARTIIITPEIIIPGEIADITPEQVFVINREVATAASGGGFAATQLFASSAAANYGVSTPITLIAGNNDINGASVSVASSGDARGRITLEPGMYLIEFSATTDDLTSAGGTLGIQIFNGSDILVQDIRQTDSSTSAEEPKTYSTPTAFRVFDAETTLTFQHYRDIGATPPISEENKSFSITITRYETAAADGETATTTSPTIPDGGENFLNEAGVIPSATLGNQQFEILAVVDVTDGIVNNSEFIVNITATRNIQAANNGSGSFTFGYRRLVSGGSDNTLLAGSSVGPATAEDGTSFNQITHSPPFSRAFPFTEDMTFIAPSTTTTGGFSLTAGRRYIMLLAYGTNGSGSVIPQMIYTAIGTRFPDSYRHPSGLQDLLRNYPWPQDGDDLDALQPVYFDGDRLFNTQIHKRLTFRLESIHGAKAEGGLLSTSLQPHFKQLSDADIRAVDGDTALFTMTNTGQFVALRVGRNTSSAQVPRFTIGVNFFGDANTPHIARGFVVVLRNHTGVLTLDMVAE